MGSRSRWKVQVNDAGDLVVPAEMATRFGLRPGTHTRIELDGNELRILRPVSELARVYIEPTNTCNFDCRTCMRNVWDEPMGFISAETFSHVMDGIRELRTRPLVFFGGYGEPLAHPKIIEMVRLAHQAGAEVELITNGSLLGQDIAERLQEAGLSRLWVSLDGATPESYEDIRLGEALPVVVNHLKALWRLRNFMGWATPRLGIAFVAMKRNIADLPAVIRLGKELGADRFSISNVLAHTQELNGEILYRQSMYELDSPIMEWDPLLDLPRMDINPATRNAIAGALSNWFHLAVARQQIHFGARACPFIQKGSTSIRWDGEVSPCLPLLHTHSSYLDDHQRRSTSFSFGNLKDRSLSAIWESSAYVSLRERVQDFDFSPCVFCNSCEMSEHNQEDCFGNVAPTCGGCLWAQGIIQCP